MALWFVYLKSWCKRELQNSQGSRDLECWRSRFDLWSWRLDKLDLCLKKWHSSFGFSFLFVPYVSRVSFVRTQLRLSFPRRSSLEILHFSQSQRKLVRLHERTRHRIIPLTALVRFGTQTRIGTRSKESDKSGKHLQGNQRIYKELEARLEGKRNESFIMNWLFGSGRDEWRICRTERDRRRRLTENPFD